LNESQLEKLENYNFNLIKVGSVLEKEIDAKMFADTSGLAKLGRISIKLPPKNVSKPQGFLPERLHSVSHLTVESQMQHKPSIRSSHSPVRNDGLAISLEVMQRNEQLTKAYTDRLHECKSLFSKAKHRITELKAAGEVKWSLTSIFQEANAAKLLSPKDEKSFIKPDDDLELNSVYKKLYESQEKNRIQRWKLKEAKLDNIALKEETTAFVVHLDEVY
jgi:hypothetical protein